jgi:protoporphyrinogen oxidase
MLGMTLALRLRQAGHAVTLYEGAASLGGLAAAWRLGDVTWDRHYHVTLASDRHTRALYAELGLEGEVEWREARSGFFSGGRLVPLSSTLDFLRFPLIGPVARARLALTILYASRIRSWKRLERVSAEAWLRRFSGDSGFERVWRPLLRSKLGEAYHDTSAAFIWATIARLYAARRSGLKRELFGIVRGGYARVLEAFASRLAEAGVEIELGAPVRRVGPRPGGGVEVEPEGAAARGFDHVVLTLAAPLAARIAPSLRPDERSRLEGVRYLGIACASLLLRRPLAGFYVTNLTDDGFPFTGVIETTALVDPARFGGRSLVYLPRYLPPDDPLLERSDAELRAPFLAGLRRIYPDLRDGDIAAFQVSRVRHVFALTTLGYSERLPEPTTSVPGLHAVSSAHVLNGTLNVDATLRLAESAARGLLSPARRVELPA